MQAIKLTVFPVKEITQATALYTALLGQEPYVTAPYYVGFRVGDQEVGLDPNGHAAGLTGPLDYWQVDDIHARLQAYVAAGATCVQPVKAVGYGRLIATVKDADNNLIGLMQM